MIKSEHQYRVTKAQLVRLEKALKRARATKANLQPRLHKAMVAGMEAQIAELRQEIGAYDSLKKMEIFS